MCLLIDVTLVAAEPWSSQSIPSLVVSGRVDVGYWQRLGVPSSITTARMSWQAGLIPSAGGYKYSLSNLDVALIASCRPGNSDSSCGSKRCLGFRAWGGDTCDPRCHRDGTGSTSNGR